VAGVLDWYGNVPFCALSWSPGGVTLWSYPRALLKVSACFGLSNARFGNIGGPDGDFGRLFRQVVRPPRLGKLSIVDEKAVNCASNENALDNALNYVRPSRKGSSGLHAFLFTPGCLGCFLFMFCLRLSQWPLWLNVVCGCTSLFIAIFIMRALFYLRFP
jgi:hypothetical protein